MNAILKNFNAFQNMPTQERADRFFLLDRALAVGQGKFTNYSYTPPGGSYSFLPSVGGFNLQANSGNDGYLIVDNTKYGGIAPRGLNDEYLAFWAWSCINAIRSGRGRVVATKTNEEVLQDLLDWALDTNKAGEGFIQKNAATQTWESLNPYWSENGRGLINGVSGFNGRLTVTSASVANDAVGDHITISGNPVADGAPAKFITYGNGGATAPTAIGADVQVFAGAVAGKIYLFDTEAKALAKANGTAMSLAGITGTIYLFIENLWKMGSVASNEVTLAANDPTITVTGEVGAADLIVKTTLPAGLSLTALYYYRVTGVAPTKFRLYSTHANALADTSPIAITNVGVDAYLCRHGARQDGYKRSTPDGGKRLGAAFLWFAQNVPMNTADKLQYEAIGSNILGGAVNISYRTSDDTTGLSNQFIYTGGAGNPTAFDTDSDSSYSTHYECQDYVWPYAEFANDGILTVEKEFLINHAGIDTGLANTIATHEKHGMKGPRLVGFKDAGGTMPTKSPATPLGANTLYWAKPITETTFQIAEANDRNGTTAVNIDGAGAEGAAVQVYGVNSWKADIIRKGAHTAPHWARLTMEQTVHGFVCGDFARIDADTGSVTITGDAGLRYYEGSIRAVANWTSFVKQSAPRHLMPVYTQLVIDNTMPIFKAWQQTGMVFDKIDSGGKPEFVDQSFTKTDLGNLRKGVMVALAVLCGIELSYGIGAARAFYEATAAELWDSVRKEHTRNAGGSDAFNSSLQELCLYTVGLPWGA